MDVVIRRHVKRRDYVVFTSIYDVLLRTYDVYMSSILTIYPIANLSYTLYTPYITALHGNKTAMVINTMDQHNRDAV